MAGHPNLSRQQLDNALAGTDGRSIHPLVQSSAMLSVVNRSCYPALAISSSSGEFRYIPDMVSTQHR